MIYYYKSYRWIDGKLKKVITDENDDIIQNPTKEQITYAIPDNRRKVCRRIKIYTDDELLNILKDFYQRNKRIPVCKDFANNPEYPSAETYRTRFGSWNNALLSAGMDIGKKTSRRYKIYTDDELLNYLKIFCEENGRIPVASDFVANYKYPNLGTYQNRFGSWDNALKLNGMDLDTIVKQGHLETKKQKSRWFEIMVRDHFENKPIDLSGNNCNSVIDGICPDGQTYEVKSSKLYIRGYWGFHTENEDKDDDKEAIQWYYFGAFNADYTELLYVWRVPGEIVEENNFYVGMYDNYKFTVKNMKEYDITDKFKKLVKDDN